MHASFEACAFREYLRGCCVGRFADDSIVGDCVVCDAHLSVFAGSRKADNLFDCQRKPVQGASAGSMQPLISMVP
jgi:hypothetical protein